jgi:galactose mutarotase-like enzyme
MKKLLSTIIALSLSTILFAESWAPQGENIKTKWAAEVSPTNARPEYPRPQMVRPDWVNLNGLWDYAISSADALEMPDADGKILVPFCIESSLSGVCKRVSKDEALWYKTTITAPSKWAGKRVLLHFDAVDWKAELWLNGTFIGSHTGGFTGFSFDITDVLSEGTAELVLKVWDPTDDTSYCVPRGKQVSNPSGIWYTPVTGIWQTVWMEAVSESFVKDYNVVTSIDGSLSVSVDVEGSADEVKVEVLRPKRGYNPEKPAWGIFKRAKAKVAVGETANLKVRRPRLWSPDAPWLYGLRIKLYKEGRLIDKVDAYTAFRSIEVKLDEAGVKRMALNREILFQFGPLDQGWWPDGLYTAPTAEAMAWDIEQTKALGFNMIRKHIKVEPSRWYYDCDRLGVLVWQDMPSIAAYVKRSDWGQGEDYYGSGQDYPATEEQKDNFYKEWREVMAMTKKFQSIVVWVPFNEAWGQFDTQSVVDFTLAQDPTRLINAASGGNWIEGAGDILDSHYYPHPKMRIIDKDMINVLGEYGGIGRPIEGHTWEIGRKWGYIQYDSEEKVTDCYVTYIEDLIVIKQRDLCCAAIYTQTTDVEGEVNGFYTYDREVLKMDMKRVREANLKVINAPNVSELPLVPPYAFHYKDPSAGVRGHLKLFNLHRGDLTMQVTDFGARVISLFAPDRNGKLDDIIVGYGDAERFVHNTGERFLGATVGRVANRIGGGKFTLDGKTYKLPQNNNGQTLHGGLLGLDMVVWKVLERTPCSVKFGYTARDGQDGFPGNLSIELTYTLTENNELEISYSATTDKATPVNLSNHAFYNLKGSAGGTILDHVLTIPADGITAVDEVLIPTGEIMPVEGTPFDFREPHVIGERIGENHPQLSLGGGYDHNWVLNVPSDGALHKACELYEDTTGRVLEVFTDQPGLQFYCGNFFDGSYCGKIEGLPIGYREALALETQKFPDGVNKPQFPDTILRPGETYTQTSVYKFSTR